LRGARARRKVAPVTTHARKSSRARTGLFSQRLKDSRALSRAAAAAMSEGWDLEPVRVRCLRDYWNLVFRVQTRRGDFLLRIHSNDYHDAREIESELAWVEALGSTMRVPEQVRSASGARVVAIDLPELGRRACTLLRWVDGRRAGPFGERTFEDLGALFARLHDHAERWTPPRGFRRPRWDANALRRYWFRPHDDRGWHGLSTRRRDRFTRAFDRLEALEEKLPPRHFGLVHADLHRGNVIRARGFVPIDFDDCGFACRIYDFAVPLASAERTASSAAGRALVRGYRRVRELPDDLLRHLDVYVAARAVAVVLFLRGWALEDERFRPRIAKYVEAADAILDATGSR
jgi:Ser/Thr protein kinase RdoA (MazF antagonist)